MTPTDGTAADAFDEEGREAPESPSRPGAVTVIAVILALQAIVLAVAVVWMFGQEMAGEEAVQGGGIMLIGLVALAVVWLVLTILGPLRLQPWSRGSVLAIEALHIAVAIGFFQGVFASQELGWLLLGPAALAIILLLTPPVVAATAREGFEER